MAQNDRALFLYGFDITKDNQFINFRHASLSSPITATLRIGNYTMTGFLAELKRAMDVADGVNTYTWAIDRTYDSGKSNRVSVTTSGSYLDILFGSGVNAGNTPATMLGWTNADLTGLTSYTSLTNAGNILIPEFPTFEYIPPDVFITNDGNKNVSAAGIKETLVFAQMKFMQGQWKYITDQLGRTQLTEWTTFLKYASKQLTFELSPSIYEDPNLFYQVTLETTVGDANGMGYKLNQMLGVGLYRFWDTGIMKFRIIPS